MSLSELESLFSSRATVAERVANLRRAVADKSIHAHAKDARFSEALGQLTEDALADSAWREEVIAVLGRVHAMNKVKVLEPKVRELIRRLLREPLRMEGINDGDDRFYVLAGCRLADSAWVPEHLAAAAVGEESHENARREAVLGLVEKTPHLEAALSLLAKAMHSWSPKTETPSDSAAKRIKRLLAAISEVLVTYESDVECEPGRPLGALVLAAVKGGVLPSAKVVGEVALQTLVTVHALVRSRFSLATEVSTYDAVRAARGWFPHGGWARWLSDEEHRTAKVALMRDVMQALTLVAKQGRCDDALFEQLVVVSGSRDAARAQATDIATAVRGLLPEVQVWLTTGERGGMSAGEAPGASLVLESRMLQEDALLARLLRDVARFTFTGALLRGNLLPELEIVAPQYVRHVEGLLSQAQMVEQGVGRIADRRGLRTRGLPGDVEEYSQLEHQLVDTGQSASVRWVRLIEPVVVRVDDDGIAVVVEKALVEPVSSRTESSIRQE
jgi:hypothetical protein